METDGHDEANSRFSQFCERAQKIVTFSPQVIFTLGSVLFVRF